MGSDPQSHLQAIYDLEHEACKKTETDLRQKLAEVDETSKALVGCANERARQTHILEDQLAEAQALIERVCIDYSHPGSPVRYGHYADQKMDEVPPFIAPKELPNIPALEDQLAEAEAQIARLQTDLRIVGGYESPDVTQPPRVNSQARIEELEAAMQLIAGEKDPDGTEFAPCREDCVNIAREAFAVQPAPAIIDTQRLDNNAFIYWLSKYAPETLKMWRCQYDTAMAQLAPKEDKS